MPAVACPQDPQNTKDKTGIGANPPGLSFVLATKNGQRLFHFGEMIEIEEDYSSRVPGARRGCEASGAKRISTIFGWGISRGPCQNCIPAWMRNWNKDSRKRK